MDEFEKEFLMDEEEEVSPVDKDLEDEDDEELDDENLDLTGEEEGDSF